MQSTKQYKQYKGEKKTGKMKHLRKELQREVKQQLERKRLDLFEQRQKGNRKHDRLYEQLTETIDCLDTRNRIKPGKRQHAK